MIKFLAVLGVSIVLSNQIFSQTSQFPYRLSRWDYGIVPAALVVKLGSMQIHKQTRLTNSEIVSLNRNSINGFDRSATWRWNSSQSRISDVTVYSLIASPVLLALPQIKSRQWANLCTFGVMYLETIAVTEGLKGLTKSLISRKRPYLYNTALTVEKRQEQTADNEAFDSFFSGHTMSAFSSAVFLSKTYTDIYGNTTMSKILWGSSLTLAAVTGWLRYSSGNHFPTDILAGAIVGGTIGYIIPKIHKISNKSENISLSLSPTSMYFSFQF